jgi:ribonuclease HI
VGKVPGVYTEWTQAQVQIRGIKKPKYRKFNTRAEAEEFVTAGRKANGSSDAGQDVNPEDDIRRLIVQKSAPGLQINGTYDPMDKDGNTYEPGRRPLPPGAEDGYDPNVKMTSEGEIVDRTEAEKSRTKMMPKEREPPGMLRIYTDGSSLRNGQVGARAGVGVFFGPQDPKYEDLPPPFLSRCKSTPGSKSKSRSKRTTPKTLFPTHRVYTMDWTARQHTLGDPDSMLVESKHQGHPLKHNGFDPADSNLDQDEKGKLTNWRYRNVSEALKGLKQTNQRAELTAILRALDIAPRHREVTIYTDSMYAIDCVTNWYRNWRRNNWLNSKGKPVENKDLVVEIRDKIEEREGFKKGTFFVWVKGHQDNPGNVAADKLAVAGAMAGRGLEEDTEAPEGRGSGATTKKTATARSSARRDDDEDDETKAAFEAMDRAMEDDGSDGEFK